MLEIDQLNVKSSCEHVLRAWLQLALKSLKEPMSEVDAALEDPRGRDQQLGHFAREIQIRHGAAVAAHRQTKH